MTRSPLLSLASVALCALLLSTLASGQTGDSKSTPDKGKAAPEKTEKAAKTPSLDKLKLPPDALIIFADELKDSLKLVPRAVLMTPEKYQELMDRIAYLEKLLKSDRQLPRSCKMTAKVDGDYLQLSADLQLVAETTRTTHFLGFRGGLLISAKMQSLDGDDEHPPLLDTAADGYTVILEKAGAYLLTLQLKVPITAGAAANDRTADLLLPGTPVTTLALDLTQPVRELRWNKVTEKAPQGQPRKQHWDLSIGKAPELTLTWKETVRLPGAGPLLTAKGHVLVSVEDQRIVTTAELTLTDLRGQTREWKLWVPAQAKIKVVNPPDDVGWSLSGPINQVYTLNLKAPTTDTIKLLATLQQARPTARAPIGPFTVLDAYKQEGTIEVKATPSVRRATRVGFLATGDIEREPPPNPANPDTLGYYRYWNMPAPVKPPAGKPTPGAQAPLELELQAATGRVEATVDHLLKIRSSETGLVAQATMRIVAKPLQSSVDFINVQLPRLFRPESQALLLWANPPLAPPYSWLGLGDWLTPDGDWKIGEGSVPAELLTPNPKNPRAARLKLGQDQTKEFTLVMTAQCTLPPGSQHARLELPRLATVLDRGGKLKIETDGTVDLLTREGGYEVVAADKQAITTAFDRTPSHIDISWRPARPGLAVSSVVDVTMRERLGIAHVRQVIEFHDPQHRETGAVLPILKKLNLLQLRVSPRISSNKLEVKGGGRLLNFDQTKGVALVMPGPEAGKETLVLEYEFPLPRRDDKSKPDETARVVDVPLISSMQATRQETKIRFWSDQGVQPALVEVPDGDPIWRDLGTEVVPGNDRLPVKVFRADGSQQSLTVQLDPGPPLLTGAMVDRVLIQVTVNEEGSEQYKVRYFITKLSLTELDIKLPGPVAGLFLQIMLDGKKVNWGAPDPAGSIARLKIEPSLYKQPVLLEVEYKLPRGQPESEGLWQTSLHPPQLQGHIVLGRVRWQVTFLAANWIPVLAEPEGGVEQHWTWRGWLLAPEPSKTSADLERWLTDKDSGDSGTTPSVVCVRTGFEPLRMVRMPQQAWLLLCSGSLLAIGLALNFAPLPRGVFWFLVALLAAALLALGLFWASALPPILFGCQPGAVVLVLILGLQWMVQERYRRQVIFMPGFTRHKQGSSLLRNASQSRPRDASTIDAPANAMGAPSGSAINKNE